MTRRGQIIFFLPALALFLVFVLIPSAQTLIDSFYSHHGPGRDFVGALYYRYALTDPKFHQSLCNNLVYMLWTLLFEVVLGLALAVWRRTRALTTCCASHFFPRPCFRWW